MGATVSPASAVWLRGTFRTPETLEEISCALSHNLEEKGSASHTKYKCSYSAHSFGDSR